MNELAVRVEGLGKEYRLGGPREQYSTLRDRLNKLASVPLRALLGRGERSEQDGLFWALKDVSFEVKRGEVVGMIGRNGAGKSTLLKILSRITEPTEGEVDIHGRVGSLLEVGTGFHPELTGRENVYLNGAILGMRQAEIARKFDEIVAFAEVEKFIDTPVKHYSSGMHMRLAFAVAAHLDPEILIVDEVLAVGDAQFQKKCLGKMGEAARGGRTVLFVSHNLAVIQTLCTRGLFLKDGCIRVDASATAAVGAYLRSLEDSASQDVAQRSDRVGRGQTRLRRVIISQGGDALETTLATGYPARFDFEFETILPGMGCCFTIYDDNGYPVTHLTSLIHSSADTLDQGYSRNFACDIDELPLVPGRYRINVAIMTGQNVQDHIEGAATFEVEQGHIRGRPVTFKTGGSVCIPHRWILAASRNGDGRSCP